MLRLLLFILTAVTLVVPAAFGEDTTLQARPSTVEGVLVQVSKLPKAEGNGYPDCYYTATMDIDTITGGASIPKKVVLVLPGFFSRQYAPEAGYKEGDKVRATVVPFSSMPDKVRQTQQADEIENVDLQFFFTQKISLIKQFQRVESPIPFATESSSASDVVMFQQVDVKARAARQEAMRKDLEQINKLLAEHGGDWDKWYESQKDFREKYKIQYDNKARKWVGDSFFSAGRIDNGRIYNSDFVKSLIALKNYLSDRNVDLIVVRFPNKGEVTDDLFSPSTGSVSNPYLLRMYKELLESDVEIIADIIPKAKEERFNYPLMYWYQDFSEIHPAEGISWVIAKELAKRVKRYERVKNSPTKTFTLLTASRDFKWPGGNPKFSIKEHVPFTAVADETGTPLQVSQGLNSPVLMVGSSILVYPSIHKGASIPQYLAYLTGVVPDILQRSGSDVAVLRNIAREGDRFLQNRSVCLFPFGPWITYYPLASLPTFNPDTSVKQELSFYSGRSLREAVELSPKAAYGTFSYTADGILNILPVKEGRGAEGSFRVKVPDAVSAFPFFAMEVQFTSKDITRVTATYSVETEFTMRSDTQVRNEETFSFKTMPGNNYVDLELSGNANFIRAVQIKSIKFFGVTEPKRWNLKVS